MSKFVYRGNIFDFAMVASIQKLKNEIPNKWDINKPPTTHVLRWKNEYLDSPKSPKTAWLNKEEAAVILEAFEKGGPVPVASLAYGPSVGTDAQHEAAVAERDLPPGVVSAPRKWAGTGSPHFEDEERDPDAPPWDE